MAPIFSVHFSYGGEAQTCRFEFEQNAIAFSKFLGENGFRSTVTDIERNTVYEGGTE